MSLTRRIASSAKRKRGDEPYKDVAWPDLPVLAQEGTTKYGPTKIAEPNKAAGLKRAVARAHCPLLYLVAANPNQLLLLRYRSC